MPPERTLPEFENTLVLRIEDSKARLVPASTVFVPGKKVGLFETPDQNYQAEIVKNDAQCIELLTPPEWGSAKRSISRAACILIQQDKLYYTEGKVEPAADRRRLQFRHEGRALCTQRRLFHRFRFRKRFHLEAITLPDGRTHPAMPATLQDCSLLGFGFHARHKLPPQTVFKSADLFKNPAEEIKNLVFFVQIVWSRGNRLFGFRHGAIFKFQSPAEQREFSRIIEQLQLKQLAACYGSFLAGQ
jgi:hypothetical protein